MSSSLFDSFGVDGGPPTGDSPRETDPIPAHDEVPKRTVVAPRKVHHVTVCMVPPPEAKYVWDTVSKMRKQLKDPGFYRWPPHANLLYPFFEFNYNKEGTEEALVDEILETLHSATKQFEPFPINLSSLGTFGGKQRGVLWLSPESIVGPETETNDAQGDFSTQMHPPPPLTSLHKALEEAFPECKDQTKGGSFTAHMTLSHFENLDDALAAKAIIERDYKDALKSLRFNLDRIYLLRRSGDDGQFLRIADIGLGANSQVERWDPAKAFPAMPDTEEEWVHEERMKLKARRNNNSGRGGNRKTYNRRRGVRPPRVPDTPEVIATKRAERKAKRDRLERERLEMTCDQDSSEDVATTS